MPPPHLFFLLADDLGWAELGYQRSAPAREVATPHIDGLVREGCTLARHYGFKFCSPSRSALLSGRNPIHVNVNNFMPSMLNPADRVSGYAGIPTEMSGWGHVMQKANYTTIFAGKWDAGMATGAHTPRGRGFDSALSYFHHTNDHWTLRGGEGCPSNRTGHGWHAYTKKAAAGGEGGEVGEDVVRALTLTPPTDVYEVRNGYLAAGDDWVSPRLVTVPAAEGLCSSSAECVGFTFMDYDSRPPANRTVKASFKTAVHFVQDDGLPPRDLWLNDGPAPASYVNPQPRCSGVPYPANGTGCAYEDDLFSSFVLGHVAAWSDGMRPLFALWAFHAVHSPYQVPKEDYDALAFVQPAERRAYHAMAMRMDRAVGSLVGALRSKSMWDASLLVFSADNGGAVTQAGNNHPLRGGKHSSFDGGVRLASFASGGWLPAHRRGVTSHRLVALWDWYATFAYLGGLGPEDVRDARAAAAGLPPIDSVDVRSVLLGPSADGEADRGAATTAEPPLAPAGRRPPRTEVAIGSCSNVRTDPFCQEEDPGHTVVSGIVAELEEGEVAGVAPGLYKLLTGWQALDCTTPASWPNGSALDCPWRDCGDRGCLYNLTADETESDDLAALGDGAPPRSASSEAAVEALLADLHARVGRHNATVFSPDRGREDIAGACDAALHRHGGFWGPFAPEPVEARAP